MLKNLLSYTVLLFLLFQLIVEINCQSAIPHIPFSSSKQRFFHTATLIDDKLYILGGSEIIGRDFFYLDFSAAFNTQQLSWQDLSSANIVPPHWGAASGRGGVNNNTLFLYGGYSPGNKMSVLYTFDPQTTGPQTIKWSVPKMDTLRTKRNLLGIVDYHGNMYLWGGVNAREDIVNDMLVLNTNNLGWEQKSLTGTPSPKYCYGATLLPDQKIIYIGGRDVSGLATTLSEVYLYDTINNSWSTMKTSGKIPFDRDSFSAVLGLDGQSVIIFGGTLVSSEDALYVLDLTNFEWSIPKISGQIPASRMNHKANVIGKYMVVTFGNGYNQSIENDILLLDISNNDEFVWTDSFTPSTTTKATDTNAPLDKPSNYKSAVLAITLGSLIFVGLIGIGSFYLYKWNRNKQNRKKIIPALGNEEGIGDKQQEPINDQEILQKPKNVVINK